MDSAHLLLTVIENAAKSYTSVWILDFGATALRSQRPAPICSYHSQSLEIFLQYQSVFYQQRSLLESD
ncbi:hypothetical protein [Chlorogloeopsis fritschii]|uniref:hypothetical protein n=1 Tax=Chlorogloeopsis fritschii TaxID=1124 RepID=UPI0023F14353|nr:hypothetical protein [Chlorogloeopsis fritschii]